jgi:cephalosporin-C deacetylase-like acetyl esterase
MSIGMIDSICPPVSVWLTYQELKGKKDITLFPQLGHVAPPVELDGRKRIYLEIKK